MFTSTDRVQWKDRGILDIRYSNGQPLTPGPYGTPTGWINVQDDPVISRGPETYDRHAAALNQIIKYQGRYYAYYHATAYKPWRDWTTNVAVSDDLVHWKKYADNPVVSGDKSSGLLVDDGRRYRLYTMHPDVHVFFGKRHIHNMEGHPNR